MAHHFVVRVPVPTKVYDDEIIVKQSPLGASLDDVMKSQQ